MCHVLDCQIMCLVFVGQHFIREHGERIKDSYGDYCYALVEKYNRNITLPCIYWQFFGLYPRVCDLAT